MKGFKSERVGNFIETLSAFSLVRCWAERCIKNSFDIACAYRVHMTENISQQTTTASLRQWRKVKFLCQFTTNWIINFRIPVWARYLVHTRLCKLKTSEWTFQHNSTADYTSKSMISLGWSQKPVQICWKSQDVLFVLWGCRSGVTSSKHRTSGDIQGCRDILRSIVLGLKFPTQKDKIHSEYIHFFFPIHSHESFG